MAEKQKTQTPVVCSIVHQNIVPQHKSSALKEIALLNRQFSICNSIRDKA